MKTVRIRTTMCVRPHCSVPVLADRMRLHCRWCNHRRPTWVKAYRCSTDDDWRKWKRSVASEWTGTRELITRNRKRRRR